MERTLGFIGCGKMASAIISGIINAKLYQHENIKASESNLEFAQEKQARLGIEVLCDNKRLAKESNIIFIATKPNQVTDVLREICDDVGSDKLIVSIAAGVTIERIEKACPNAHVIRVMPNAPLMVQLGMSAIVKGSKATISDVEVVKEILENLGECIVTTEDKIDIVTAISGSGPAFFYKVIHEIALAGEKLGMAYEDALLLAEQTAMGSAKLMMQSDLTPSQLIENISTKGGCTAVGVEVMNEFDTEKIFDKVIEKTTQKANALGK
ncbi:pyrroline-5-carboxylate reductase [bacterium]|nr:pyrroline-5-carboxylate reductase [bacterium]